MHPVLFKIGSFTVYSYGFLIAVGAVTGFFYMARQGKRQFGMTMDQANTLFILLIAAGVIGGKLFMIFEDPSYYIQRPGKLLTSSGFVFYGSLLLCIPAMLWYFRRNRLPVLAMLDVMAIVTCIVHGFGRLGCLMAGCCYGEPTDAWWGIVFTNPTCQARPLDTPLHPTQLIESLFIFSLMAMLLVLRSKKKFDGQIFLLYLIVYAVGRGAIETLRGDLARGFVIDGVLSNSQFISLLIVAAAVYFYVKLRRKGNLVNHGNRSRTGR